MDVHVTEDHACAICKKTIESLPKVTLGEKGSTSIYRAREVLAMTLYIAHLGTKYTKNVVVSIMHQIK